MGKSVVSSALPYALDGGFVDGYSGVEAAFGDVDLHVEEVDHCVYLVDLDGLD